MNRLAFTLFILLSAFYRSANAYEFSKIQWTPDFELGHQLVYGAKENKLSKNLGYTVLSLKTDFPTESATDLINTRISLRGALDTQGPDEISIRAFNLNYGNNWLTVTAGFQEIAWGETFGVYISDLVNSKDLRDPFLNDLSWIRIPTASLLAQINLDNWTLQAIVTPFPKNNQFPDEINHLKIVEPPALRRDNVFEQAEWGAKLGRLFSTGLDVNFFALYHWNRNPVFAPQLVGTTIGLMPIVQQTKSTGLSFTQAWDKVVLRGDFVYHLQTPLQPDFTQRHRIGNFFQAILGSDLTLEENLILGAQYHGDYDDASNRHWLGLRVSKPLLRQKLTPELFVFQGINNSDTWIQPKIRWNTSANLSLDFEYSWIPNFRRTAQPGYFGTFENYHRVFSWLKYKF